MGKRVLTPEQYRHLASEQDFQRAVIQLAKVHGWKVYHPWISVHSQMGFPDLTMLRAGDLIFAELKSMSGKVGPSQDDWLTALTVAGMLNPRVRCYLWRPDDWPTIERVLAEGLV
jgi:hypothetical protein